MANKFRDASKNGFDSVRGTGPIFKGEALYYTTKSSNAAYIRITRCFAKPESIFDDKLEQADTEYMLHVFDSLLRSFESLPAIIIDVRSNGGGHGGFELASRFCQKRTLTHFKTTKIAGDYSTFSKIDSCFLEPNTGFRYLKKIVVLCNDRTASSAEDFALSMAALPGVTVLGDHTSGLFSDMYSTELSNNISFTLSNERYYSLQLEMLEEKGVSPDFTVLQTRSDVLKNTDVVINQTLEKLRD